MNTNEDFEIIVKNGREKKVYKFVQIKTGKRKEIFLDGKTKFAHCAIVSDNKIYPNFVFKDFMDNYDKNLHDNNLLCCKYTPKIIYDENDICIK